MATADTARLIASMEMDDRKFRAGAARTMQSVNRIDKRLGAFSGAVNRNMSRLVDSAITAGARIATSAFTNGINSLAELESATTAVDGAIKQMGQSGALSSSEIARWANEIEGATDAAFDDKDIVRNAAALIRYGKVVPSNLKQALQVMTDMAAKTGSVDSASKALAKALADPAKAAGALKKAGVVLNASQLDQLKALTSLNKKEQEHYASLRKTNKAAAERYKQGRLNAKQIKAQEFLLDEIGKTTENSARDMNGSFVDMQKTLADTREDAEKLFAEGAFPVVEKIGLRLKAALADPETMDGIRNIGRGLGNALDKGLAFAESVDWGAIGSGLEKAAGFAGDLVSAFAGLPPEAQAAIIALAGLNKLTGGAVTGIVTELGKGLVKGVLGMTAGVVHIKAGVVTGAGGIPGVPGGAPTPGIAPNLAPMGLLSVFGIGAAGAAAGTAAQGLLESAQEWIADSLFGKTGANRQGVGTGFDIINSTGPGAVFHNILGLPDAISKLGDIPGDIQQIVDFVTGKPTATGATPLNPGDIMAGNLGKLEEIKGEQQATILQLAASERAADIAASSIKTTASDGLNRVDNTTRGGLANTAGAVNTARAGIVGAIQSNRPIVSTTVTVSVSATGVTEQTTVQERVGPTTGDKGGGGGNGAVNKYD